MKSPLFLAFFFVSIAGAVAAGPFGTREQARDFAIEIIALVDEQGLSAAAQAIIATDSKFRKSRMGINLFDGTVVIADNREPESVSTDYLEITDLTGEPIWPAIAAAADAQDDAELLWYHYDTQEEYAYKCFSMRATRENAVVMVCR